MTNHPNRGLAAKVVTQLLRYETDGSNPPDGRRVISDKRMTLEVAIQRDAQRIAAERDLAHVQHPTSNQGVTQIAAIHKRLRVLPDASHLGQVIAEARRVLDMWTA
jgi:hypothetical protein